MTLAAVGKTRLPLEPLRQALLDKRKTSTYTSLASDYAARSGKSFNYCARVLARIISGEIKTVHEVHADEVCVYLLGITPTTIYREVW